MGITDFFRPKYRHSDVKVRLEAVRALTSDDAAILSQIAKTDRDAAVRRAAIEKLDEADVLADIARADAERALRDLAGERAAELWVSLACDDEDETAAAAALSGLVDLGDQRALAQVAAKAADPALRRRALEALTDGRALAELARESSDAATRLEAVARITEPEALRAVAIDTQAKEIGIAAVDRIESDEALEAIAQKAKSKQVRQRARRKLTDREEAARAAKPKVSDELKRRRAEKAQALRHMEQLAETFDWEHSLDEVRLAEVEWAAIGDAGEPALDEKFAKLKKRYYERRDVHFAKLDEARAAHAHEVAAKVAPAPEPRAERREERTERTERKDDGDVVNHAALAAMAAAMDPAREARDKEAAARREERARQKAEADAKRAQEIADREARQKELAARGVEVAASLEALCADLEHMITSTDQRAVQRLLEQAGKVHEQIGKVAADVRESLEARYQAARGALVTKARELREAEDWQRFANVPRQEGLIKEAEALAAAEAPTLPQLQELQKRWKSVGPAPQQSSKALWERFKTACDAAFAKIKGAREVEKAAWGENAAARERLVAEAEGLAESTEWEATAERLKAMQAEWKALGPVPRKQGDELWKRFRGACDRFFERRKPLIEARTEELLANLEAKQALCAKVEALVAGAPGEAGWGAAIGAVKAAQRDWRDLGHVPRREADAIYARFRAACDALFDKRDLARDAEAEAQRAEVEALRGEIEAISAAGEGAAARAIAVHAQLRALGERGLQPSIELAGLYERMMRHVIATDAAGLKGTELDPDAVQKRRDKLTARAEELLPKAPATVGGDASPEEVAAKLRAALKSNALGAAKWDARDPREVIDELRAEWAQLGPVVGDAAEAARGRFEAACAAVVAAAGGERAREEHGERGARDDRGDRGDRGERGDRRRERRQRRARENEAQTEAAVTSTEAAPAAVAAPAPSADAPAGLAAIAAAAGQLTGVAADAARPARPAPSRAPATPIAIAGPNDVTSRAAHPAAAAAAPAPSPAPEPVPAPPVLPATATAAAPAPAPARARSITTPPPADPIDETWGEDDAAPAPAKAAPAADQPPGAGEMAGDGATEGDGIDAGWD